jgi:hypothetical protein
MVLFARNIAQTTTTSIYAVSADTFVSTAEKQHRTIGILIKREEAMTKEAELRELMEAVKDVIEWEEDYRTLNHLGKYAPYAFNRLGIAAAALAGQGQPEPDVRRDDCRLVCERCAKGDIPTVMTTTNRGDLYFHTPEYSKSYVCLATKIWASIAAQPTQPEGAGVDEPTPLVGESYCGIPENPFSEWDDPEEEDENENPDDCCVMCGKPLPIEGFCCEEECLKAAAGGLSDCKDFHICQDCGKSIPVERAAQPEAAQPDALRERCLSQRNDIRAAALSKETSAKQRVFNEGAFTAYGEVLSLLAEPEGWLQKAKDHLKIIQGFGGITANHSNGATVDVHVVLLNDLLNRVAASRAAQPEAASANLESLFRAVASEEIWEEIANKYFDVRAAMRARAAQPEAKGEALRLPPQSIPVSDLPIYAEDGQKCEMYGHLYTRRGNVWERDLQMREAQELYHREMDAAAQPTQPKAAAQEGKKP